MFYSIEQFLPQLEHFRLLIYWLAVLASFLEALAGVGLLVPGTVFVMACGFAAAQGYIDVVDLIWSVAIGAVLGDGLSFYLGRKGTRLFKPENKLMTVALLDRGTTFFQRHGGKSIFLGRFFGPLRAAIPFVAGTCHMSTGTFLLWNVLSAVGWALTYVLLGYFFGHAWRTLMLWSSRLGALVAAIAVFLLGTYFMLRLLARKGKAAWELCRSVAASVWAGFAGNPHVQALVKKHPGFFTFTANRLRTDRFAGLPLSLLLIMFVYVLGLLLGVVEDLITSDPIVAADHRIEDLLYVFRNPSLVKAFLWITALGKWQIVVSGTATASILLFLNKKSAYILPFWLTLIGNGLMVMLGKLAFHRARPIHNVYVESSYAFPSGHAAGSVVFYGFLTFLVMRWARSWRTKLDTAFLAVVLIVAIGFSRLYLGVHYLSDVWAGYLLGSLWLITAIIGTEWLRSRGWPHARKMGVAIPSRSVDYALIIMELAFCTFFAIRYNPPRNMAEQKPRTITVADSQAAFFAEPDVPKYTETLMGRRKEPISLIIVAANDEALIKTFQKAGWYLADPVTPRSVLKIAGASLANTTYVRGPVSPSFWNNKVNELAFEKPTARDTIRKRHHVRFWKSRFVTKNGRHIYVGTASFDKGIKWPVTHSISPDIDNERDLIYTDLRQTGLVESSRRFQLVNPTIGHNTFGDEFFTDGKTYWLELKNIED